MHQILGNQSVRKIYESRMVRTFSQADFNDLAHAALTTFHGRIDPFDPPTDPPIELDLDGPINEHTRRR